MNLVVASFVAPGRLGGVGAPFSRVSAAGIGETVMDGGDTAVETAGVEPAAVPSASASVGEIRLAELPSSRYWTSLPVKTQCLGRGLGRVRSQIPDHI